MFVRKKTIQELQSRLNSLAEDNKDKSETINLMSDQIQELQVREDYGTWGKNQYTSREKQVQALLDKYAGDSEYGCELVQRISLIRSAFALPVGVKVEPSRKDEDAEAEVEFAEKFLETNNLDQKNVLKAAIERELQGTIAFALSWDARAGGDDEIGMTKLKYLPWDKYGYQIKPVKEGSLSKPYRLVYNSESKNDQTIEDSNFEYSAINNRLGETLGRPLLGNIIHILESLSMDLADWRSRNKQFGKPTPFFSCQDSEQVRMVQDKIEQKGWKAGNAIAAVGDLEFKEPSSNAPFEKSVETEIKIVSAVTNIHPHFIGFPDLLSNRSTSESMGESTEIISKSEVREWENLYTSLIRKSILLRNDNVESGKKLDPEKVKAVCGGFSDREWQRIKNIWLPLFKEGGISVHTLLSKLPEMDIEEEKERLKSSEQESLSPESGFSGFKEPVE